MTGLTDAEGSFLIEIRKDSSYRAGWMIVARYSIVLHRRDEELLKLIQAYFGGVGRISSHGLNTLVFRVNTLKDNLTAVIPHFDKYPLITQKHSDYLLFRDVVMMMSRGEHITPEGIQTIVNIRASLNLGLTEALKEAFPMYTPVARPCGELKIVEHPQWIAGFTSGEGSFMVSVTNRASYKAGALVTLSFRVVQHSRDEYLMKSFPAYWGCGKYYSSSKGDHGDFRVEKFSDISEIIIPFFHKYPIIGVKAADFQDWCKVAELMNTKKHLTSEGLDQIRKIKEGMNKNRV